MKEKHTYTKEDIQKLIDALNYIDSKKDAHGEEPKRPRLKALNRQRKKLVEIVENDIPVEQKKVEKALKSIIRKCKFKIATLAVKDAVLTVGHKAFAALLAVPIALLTFIQHLPITLAAGGFLGVIVGATSVLWTSPEVSAWIIGGSCIGFVVGICTFLLQLFITDKNGCIDDLDNAISSLITLMEDNWTDFWKPLEENHPLTAYKDALRKMMQTKQGKDYSHEDNLLEDGVTVC